MGFFGGFAVPLKAMPTRRFGTDATASPHPKMCGGFIGRPTHVLRRSAAAYEVLFRTHIGP